MMRTSVDLLQGTLDLIVLKALSWRAMHGFGLARWIQLTTDSVLQVEEGSLYPALYRMENRGWIKASWALTENGRKRSTTSSPPPAAANSSSKHSRGISSPARSEKSWRPRATTRDAT